MPCSSVTIKTFSCRFKIVATFVGILTAFFSWNVFLFLCNSLFTRNFFIFLYNFKDQNSFQPIVPGPSLTIKTSSTSSFSSSSTKKSRLFCYLHSTEWSAEFPPKIMIWITSFFCQMKFKQLSWFSRQLRLLIVCWRYLRSFL